MLCSFELNHKTVIHEKIESRVTDRSSFIAYANRNLPRKRHVSECEFYR